ncbi:MAG TPA: hypothetical protein VGO21_04905 [Candidatus Paceibacterota bacterium]|jgi:hypothetical protein|nr:hypothetical protein [Candidatus Paceibacterota bacterium]
MLLGGNNLKDTDNVFGLIIKDSSVSLSYNKTNKLVTALYMVTDILDKEEPIRHKLRTLGTGIISDIHTIPKNVVNKISEIMSLLDIASAVNIISPMNCNILRKEFLELDQSIKEFTGKAETINKQINLSEFFAGEAPIKNSLPNNQYKSIGHHGSTRIGVQKGSTLMKALSDRIINENNFEVLKRKRRVNILNIVKNNGGNANIKDIKNKLSDNKNDELNVSEKTLQRELISLVKDGVLNKTGEKRWSRYFLPS